MKRNISFIDGKLYVDGMEIKNDFDNWWVEDNFAILKKVK